MTTREVQFRFRRTAPQARRLSGTVLLVDQCDAFGAIPMSHAVACCAAILSIAIAVAACRRPQRCAWASSLEPTVQRRDGLDSLARGRCRRPRQACPSATCTRNAAASRGWRVVVSGRIRSAPSRRQFGNRVICKGPDPPGGALFRQRHTLGLDRLHRRSLHEAVVPQRPRECLVPIEATAWMVLTVASPVPQPRSRLHAGPQAREASARRRSGPGRRSTSGFYEAALRAVFPE